MESRTLTKFAVLPVILLLGSAVYFLFFWHRDSDRSQVDLPDIQQPQTATEASPSASVDSAPPHADIHSDCPIREHFDNPQAWIAAVEDWTRNTCDPLLKSSVLRHLLKEPELLRPFVAIVNNVSSGEQFTSHLPLSWFPSTPYEVIPTPRGIIPASSNGQRYHSLLSAFRQVEIKPFTDLLPSLYPALQYLHQELGQSTHPFSTTLQKAFDRIHKIRIPSPPPLLERGVQTFTYLLPDFETLPPANKIFMRLGDSWNALKSRLSEWNLQVNLLMQIRKPSPTNHDTGR